jgi:hypothetical protein
MLASTRSQKFPVTADQILVVEQGRIVERGTHEELYELQGRYRELYDKQHGLESNLFLAPGEGDAYEVPTDSASGKQNGGRGEVADALRLLAAIMPEFSKAQPSISLHREVRGHLAAESPALLLSSHADDNPIFLTIAL